ncbi:MAG: GspE/PulE/PilB domain-containing protein [Planctomycetota bacterium]|jgi:hypothetical protein
MGRWVRWFGAEGTGAAVAEAGTPPKGKGSPSKRVIRVTTAQARDAARSGTGLPKNAAPAPTGVISIEQLAAEMLTAVLVQEKLLTQAEEHVALTEHRATGRPVEAILVETGAVAEADLLGVLSRRCKAPLLSLERYRFRPEVLGAVPSEFARANRVIPLERLGKVLNVATSNPLDVGTLTRLEEETGLRVKPFLASPREVAASLDQCYPPPPEESLPEAEETPFSTSQILKESWLGLMGGEVVEGEPPQAPVGEAPAPSEEPATPAPAPAPAAEKAVPLSEEDVTAFARVTSGVLYRSWAGSVGVGAEGPQAAVPVSDAEYALMAAPEPLPKRPPPKKKKRVSTREKSAKTRSGKKKAKRSRKKKSRR